MKIQINSHLLLILRSFQDLIWSNCEKEFSLNKLGLVLESICSPRNPQDFDVCKVNYKFWRKVSQSTLFDLKLHKANTILSKTWSVDNGCPKNMSP